MADLSAEWVAEQLRKSADDDLRVAAQSGFVGTHERDIVLIDSSRGVLVVLEVKDWSEPYLRGTRKTEKVWEIRGLGERKAPLKQAEEGMLALLRRLPPDCRPKRQSGNATVEYSWLCGAAFPNLSSAEAHELGLLADERLLPPTMPYLWQTDFQGNPVLALRGAIDAALKGREWKPGRMPKRFRDKLWSRISPDENAAPRAEHRRLTTRGARAELDPEFASKLVPQHGHHRVNGVVGSGKTLYIAYKSLEKGAEAANRNRGVASFSAAPNRDVLVICKTRSAASKLRNDITMVAKKSYAAEFDWHDYVEVHHQYGFLQRYYHADDPKKDDSEFCRRQQPLVTYDAVLVDEYQDFGPNWGAFLARHVRNAKTGLLLLTFDPAQGLPLMDLAPRFDEVVKAMSVAQGAYDWKGRNHYLGKCFRVPARIGLFAVRAHVGLTEQRFDDQPGASAEALARVIHRAMRPHFVSTDGSVLLRPAKVNSLTDEALAIWECIEELCQTTDCTPGEMILAVPPKPFNADEGKALADQLGRLEIDNLVLLGADREHFYRRGDRLVIGTPIRIKGLEIPIVIIAPSLLRYLEADGTRKDAFYQAATRATSRLVVIGEGALFDELVELHEALN